YAGEVAAEAIAQNDVSEKMLQEYERRWRGSFGNEIANNLIVKETFFSLSDEDLDSLAGSIKDVDFKEMDLIDFITALFKANKKLLWNLRPLFTQKLKQKFSGLTKFKR
ncbi:MAG: NAD(P)/FAD-dependent oxidoreductase, partial [Methanococcoides sp.]|nr:NAD(P)/FAD-dependent oxidoreductase [Methanococcoides sp.]